MEEVQRGIRRCKAQIVEVETWLDQHKGMVSLVHEHEALKAGYENMLKRLEAEDKRFALLDRDWETMPLC